MEHKKEKEITRDELRREFQLERMILFSDAVFAIVMTLMAIEIQLPSMSQRDITDEVFMGELVHVLPPLIAYATTYAFIGIIWYKHLHIFSLLRDYDKGLVIRNLVVLFLVGLFPFSVTLVAKVHNISLLPMYIYIGVILSCRIAQYFLNDYILIRKPDLRVKMDIQKELDQHRDHRFWLISISIVVVLMIITNQNIKDPDYRSLSFAWFLLVPLMRKILGKFRKRKMKKAI